MENRKLGKEEVPPPPPPAVSPPKSDAKAPGSADDGTSDRSFEIKTSEEWDSMLKLSKDKGTPLFVKFTATWCGKYCYT
jgi:hypothetical protein